MDLLLFLPYFFSGLMLSCLCGALLVKDPFYALLLLVGMVLNMAILFISINSEFLAFLLIIVYAGAVAVLFLFVVMMINYKASITAKRPITAGWPFVAILLIFFIYEIIRTIVRYVEYINGRKISFFNIDFSSLYSIGQALYGNYHNELILVSVILLIAVVGSVLMTIKYVKIVPKRIPVADQITRSKIESVYLAKPDINHGIDYTKNYE